MGDSDTFSVTQGRLCLMDEVFVFSQSGHVKISDILGSSHSPPTLVDCQAEIMSAANNPEARLEHGDPAVVVAGLEQVATPKRCFFFLVLGGFQVWIALDIQTLGLFSTKTYSASCWMKSTSRLAG